MAISVDMVIQALIGLQDIGPTLPSQVSDVEILRDGGSTGESGRRGR